MVLVDTSVWIRFFSGTAGWVDELPELLLGGQVVGHELVLGELLMGDVGGRMRRLADYEVLPYATTIPHSEVVEFARRHRFHGRGIGWIDAHLLASAVVDRVRLWTADPRLNALARELHVGY